MKTVKVQNNSEVFPYIAFIADEVSASPALVIQLHGAGERGDGSDLDRVLLNGFGDGVDLSEFRDFVLVMPQCPKDTFWVARVESIKKFIDTMIEKYNIDKNRVYLVGLSMGGYGTWYTAMAYPDMFAAIAPCCGGGMPWNAPALKMPVWAFHGALDDLVLPSNSIDMINALRKTNDNVRFDLYEDVKHNSWKRAFTPELMRWLLEQKK